jgi:hypothetical protein
MLRIPHRLDSRLTDGGKAVSLTRRLPFNVPEIFQGSGTHFCWRLSKPHGLMRSRGLGKLIKINVRVKEAEFEFLIIL